MEKVVFWKDRDRRTIDPTLFSAQAEETAKRIRRDHDRSPKANKRTQIRKFYDEVLRLDQLAQSAASQWETVLPQVHMLVAKAAYAKGRELISDDFLSFIRGSIAQIEKPEDLSVFANFFEAFMGFYRMYGPRN